MAGVGLGAAATRPDPSVRAPLVAGRGGRRATGGGSPTSPRGRRVQERRAFGPGAGHVRRRHRVHRRRARARGRSRQPLSRSPRKASADAENETEPPARPPALSRISSTVGVLASSMSRLRRYSCSDWRAAAARWRNTACVSSGTSLIWMLGMAPLWLSSCQITSPGANCHVIVCSARDAGSGHSAVDQSSPGSSRRRSRRRNINIAPKPIARTSGMPEPMIIWMSAASTLGTVAALRG